MAGQDLSDPTGVILKIYTRLDNEFFFCLGRGNGRQFRVTSCEVNDQLSFNGSLCTEDFAMNTNPMSEQREGTNSYTEDASQIP